jgi:hypothetical protein
VTAAFASQNLKRSARLARLFEADPVDRVLWDTLASRARGLGFGASGDVEKQRLEPKQPVAFSFELQSGRCALAAATGSRAVDRLSLCLYGDDRLLSADLKGQPHAAALCCAEQTQVVRAVVEVKGGAGQVTTGYFTAKRDRVADLVGPPLRAASRPVQPAAVVRPSVDLLIQEASNELGAVGLNLNQIVQLEQVGEAAFGFDTVLSAEACFGFAVVSTETIREARLADPLGATVSSWQGASQSVLLSHCPVESGAFSIEVVSDSKDPERLPYLAVFASDHLRVMRSSSLTR